MAALVNIPGEILFIIVHLIDRSSLLSFALVNKRINYLCQPVLVQHQTLHEKWAYVAVTFLWNDLFFGTGFLRLLKAAFCDPSVIWYIREIDASLGDKGGRWCGEIVPWNDSQEDYDKLVEELQALVPITTLIHDDSSRQGWLSSLELPLENGIHIAEIFLPILTRLHTLSVDVGELDAVIRWLPAERHLFLGIKNISFFDIYDDGIRVDKAIICTWLPSLEKLKATGLLSCDNGSFESPPQGMDRCPLKSLSLTDGGISWAALEAILRGVRQDDSHGLRHFTYVHDSLYSDYGNDHFDGPRILGVLYRHCRNTLTTLEIDITNNYYSLFYSNCQEECSCGSRHIPTLGLNLKRLNQIKMLTTSCEMLVDGWWQSSRSGQQGLHSVLGDFLDKSIPQTPLCKILPRSVQILSLKSEKYPNAARIVTKKLLVLLERDYEEVPNLKDLNLGWTPKGPWYKRLNQVCFERDIKLVFLNKTCVYDQ